MVHEVLIGAAAKAAGCSVPSVRYYEDVGLLAGANRTQGGHRAYQPKDVARLVLIRRCRDFVMSIKQVKTLVEIRDRPASCDNALDVVTHHRDALRVRIAELKALDRAMSLIAARCESDCAGGAAACCSIYDDLATVPENALSAYPDQTMRGQFG